MIHSVYISISISPAHKFYSKITSVFLPVSINEAGVDIVRALHTSDWLKTDARGLKRHDVHQSVLEFVTRQVGTDES